ncbi:MAG: hypothetical protein K8F91_25670 [Candidatus Obscuribacterales bacterium]|nr:hypothetical protein [Candidatus Obscuribacterales bacterium]
MKPGTFLIALLLLIAITAVWPSPCRAESLDASIIKESLSETICPTNIEVMIRGSEHQNSPNYDPQVEPQRHFKESSLARSYKYMRNEQTRVLDFAASADSDPEMRTRALFHFGMLLHTTNCFYLNTDYLPKKIDNLEDISGAAFDPYSIALFDWRILADKNRACDLQVESNSVKQEAILNRVVQDTTIKKVARGLAIREARRQWDYLGSLIQNRYHDKAATILAALKSASCENLIPKDIQ